MLGKCLRQGLRQGLRAVALCAVLGFAAIQPSAQAAELFPFDQDLMLDAAPMRPGKRMPTLTVAADGNATIGLWCKTIPARVELSESAIKIEPGPLPEALPDMMGNGQCTDARLQADQDLRAALEQVTEWRMQGSAVILTGPKTLKFRPSMN